MRHVLCAILLASAAGCASRASQNDALAGRLDLTCASLDVLHAGVTVRDKSGAEHSPLVHARIEREGSLRTTSAGRAVVRTDDGLELRVAGDSEIRVVDGIMRVVKGRVYVSSWGVDERSIRLGDSLTIRVTEASLELEREPNGAMRAIGVRGEVGWRTERTQGRLAQGQMLAGQGEPELQPAVIWEDWTGGAASPQGVATQAARGSARAVLHAGVGEPPTELATNEHKVTVRIDGDAAMTEVVQTFFNGSNQTAPVEYRLRLPEGAMVASFGIAPLPMGRFAPEVLNAIPYTTFGPASISGLGTGQGQIALLRNPDGSYFARLSPLVPGQSMRVRLNYVEWLHREGPRRTFTYAIGDAQSPPFVGEFLFDMHIDRGGVGAIRGPVGSMTTGRERLRITRSDYRPRGDVVVELFDSQAPTANQATARVFRSRTALDGQQFAMVDLTLPAETPRGTDLVVVVDTSSATDPGTLTTASAAVDALLQSLGPDDRVQLLFGDLRARPAEGNAGQLGTVDSVKRRAVLEALSHVRPAGATDIGRVLTDAYERLDSTRNGAVIYLGDATPTMGTLDPDRLVDETLRLAPDLRLYVVALGADAHPEVLARLTSRGGLGLRAADQSEAVLAAQRVLSHATRPMLRDVHLDLGPAMTSTLPARIEQWVVGDPLRVYGPLTREPPRTLTVTAREGRTPRTWTITPATMSISDDGDLRRRWATARLQALDLAGASAAAMADIGARFGLVTATSALVYGGAPTNGSGVLVAGSAWPDAGMRTRLPNLGVGDSVEPRGIRLLFEPEDYPMFTDDESGWHTHTEDEGADGGEMLSELLALAEPEAEACVQRARSARPALTGSMTVTARIDLQGVVRDVRMGYSTLRDSGAEACIRRAVGALRLPRPEMFDAQPAEVSHTYSFNAPFERPRGSRCPATSRLDRSARVVLWRERMQSQGTDPVASWSGAQSRCELRQWEDRAALIDLLVNRAPNAMALGALRGQLPSDAAAYLDRVVARRWGPSAVWTAYLAGRGHINWGALVRYLARPQESLENKIARCEAYARLAPHDVDVRLKLLSLYEQSNRRNEARHMGEQLRRDPWADSRVRAIVGETLIRMGDREAGLAVFSEIAEHAPYDVRARGRLGDLLLTYGGEDYAEEAYRQFRTLVALQPGETIHRVRMALAALIAGREDEALRLFRIASEDAQGDATGDAVEALIVQEVARIQSARPNEPAVRAWARVAQLFDLARTGGVVLRWSHPDAAVQLRAMAAGDSEYLPIGEDSDLKVRVFRPGSALEGSRLIVRAPSGVAGRRSVVASVVLLVANAGRVTVVTRNVTLDASHRVIPLIVRNGRIEDDTSVLPGTEVLAPDGAMY
ncbi:MAG: AgmX/PglI C-terminal domain-containing protein [Deltaproteobacteria bacterium]|nr:AgmX/PglI C-terminal domain-containing protein [Deltaproteobacteria bacterium]